MQSDGLCELGALPVLDVEQALLLVEGERELLEEIIQLYRTTTAERVADLQVALADGCLEGVAAAAHSIKGASSNICAARLRTVAARLETDARQARTDHLSELCGLVQSEFERFQQEVEFAA